MENLVSIRVIIGQKTDRKRTGHKYPDFNSMRDRVKSWADGSDWAHFIDRFGGWHYDNEAGHDDDDPENGSPRGVWVGMLCVPEDFANAAVSLFPEQVSIMDEAECQAFYETRCTAQMPEIEEDLEALQAIVAKKALGIDDASDVNALDPDHPARGRRRNKLKTWAGYKQQRGIQIDAEATKRISDRAKRKSVDT